MELSDIIAIGAVCALEALPAPKAGRKARGKGTPPAPKAAAAAVLDIALVAAQDVLDIALVAEHDHGARTINHSSDHMKDCRMAKHKRKSARELATVKADNAQQQARLQLATISFPSLRSIAGTFKAPKTALADASATARLAMKRLQRDDCARQSQNVAAFIVSSTITTLQEQRTRDIMFGPEPEAFDVPRILIHTHQHDETNQKCRLKIHVESDVPGLRSAPSQISVQVMVARGDVYVFEGDTQTIAEPFHRRSVRLMGQSTKFILAGIERYMPVCLTDIPAIAELARLNEWVVFGWSIDQCITNFSALNVQFDRIHHDHSPNVIGYVEPCGVHCAALSKGRAPGLKAINVVTHAWSRWNRVGTNMAALTKTLLVNIQIGCEVILGPPPDDLVAHREAS